MPEGLARVSLAPTHETGALYRSMRTDELQQLKRAFELDKAHSDKQETTAFADSRLALIADVLRERSTEASV